MVEPTSYPSQLGTSIIRTVVPIIVAAIVSFFARRDFDLGGYQSIISEVIGAAVATVYYGAVRILETHVKPWWGWLLLKAKPPVYGVPAQPDTNSPTKFVATFESNLPTGKPVKFEEVN